MRIEWLSVFSHDKIIFTKDKKQLNNVIIINKNPNKY